MADPNEVKLNTVTVLGSRLLEGADAIAIALVTREMGAIAFKIDLSAIASMRRHLDMAEQLLCSQKGNSPARPS